MRIIDQFQGGLLLVARKMDSNEALICIKEGFTALMPLFMAGSFGTLLSSLVSSTQTGLAQFIPALATLGPIFSALTWCSMTFMAIPVTLLIAMAYAKRHNVDQWLAGILAVAAYISMVPQSLSIDETVMSGLGDSVLGAQGMFIGIISALVVSKVFVTLTGVKGLQIKLPDAVPAGVARSFSSMIPICIILLITSAIGQIVPMLTGMYINELLYTLLQMPLQGIMQHPAGVITLAIVTQLFWLLGIHGGMLMTSVAGPLMMAALSENVAAMEAGLTPSNPVTYQFLNAFVRPGGQGVVIAIAIAILLFSKREDYRSITKVSFVPTLFNISEPMVFGVPLMLNPTLAIPFILNPGIGAAIGMIATNAGFLSCNTVGLPFSTPIIIAPFIAYGWQGVVIQLLIIGISVLVATPFVLLANKEQLGADQDMQITS